MQYSDVSWKPFFLKVGSVLSAVVTAHPQIIPVLDFSWSNVEVCMLKLKMEKQNNAVKRKYGRGFEIKGESLPLFFFSLYAEVPQKESLIVIDKEKVMLHLRAICRACFFLT